MTRNSSACFAAGMVITALLLTACGTSAPTGRARNTSAPSYTNMNTDIAPVQKDWTLFRQAGEGFALSLPGNWQQFDLSKETMTSIMGKMNAANPQLGAALSSQVAGMAAQGIKFYAFDLYSPTAATGFATNINVLRQDLPSNPGLDSLIKESIGTLKEQLKAALSGPITSSRLTTIAGDNMGRINYDIVLNTPDGRALTLSVVQYVYASDNNLYILSCTTTIDRIEEYSHTFELIAQGFYLLE
jgi:hypothetical protein